MTLEKTNIHDGKVFEIKNWGVIIGKMSRQESLLFFLEKTLSIQNDPEEIDFLYRLVEDRISQIALEQYD